MIVSDVVIVESEPFFIDYNSYTMVLGAATPRISSKCFWNVSLESKVIPRNFTRGYILSSSPYSFRTGSDFLARGDLAGEYDDLSFSKFSFILHLTTTLPISVRLYAKVLLQIVHFYYQPIEQCHQRTGISSFVCGEDLVSH